MEGDGTPTGDYYTQEQLNALTNNYTAAADTAEGASIPADIPTADAATGVSFWNSLSGVGSSLKGAAMDFLGADATWGAFGSIATTIPLVAAGAAAGFIGWKIGSAVASLFDNSQGTTCGEACTTSLDILTATAQVPIAAGASLPFTASGACSQCVSLNVKAPADGYVLSYSCTNGCSSGGEIFEDTTNNADGCSSKVIDLPATAVMEVLAQTPPSTSNGYCGPTVGGVTYSDTITAIDYFVPAVYSSLPGAGQGTSQPATVTETTTLTAPTEAAQKANALAQLESPATASNPGAAALNGQLCITAGSACYGSGVGPTTSPTTGTKVTLPPVTANETYPQWQDAARSAGLLGTITNVTLSDTQANPTVAPSDVVATDPASGSQVDPDTAVSVETNPATEQAVAAPSAPGSAPGVTLPTAGTPCNVFPFGIPCWLSSQLSSFNATPVAPNFSLRVPRLVGGGSMPINLGGSMFGASFSSVMSIVRPILLVLSFIGIVLWLGGMALGGSTSGGSTSDGGDS